MNYKNPWKYNNKIFNTSDIQDYHGFVYEITNKKTKRKYIGKKTFYFSKTYQKNKKRKRKLVESDWKLYYGSSNILKDDIKELGEDNFKRKILFLCYSKGECNYIEAKTQFLLDALLKEEYYNSWIHVKVSESHVKKLRNI